MEKGNFRRAFANDLTPTFSEARNHSTDDSPGGLLFYGWTNSVWTGSVLAADPSPNHSSHDFVKDLDARTIT
jgi:hypothetical protein